jgi:DNA polymerase III delta subunit
MPRKKSQIKTDRLNFWLPNALCERVKKVAAEKGWTITEAARNLIAEGLESHGRSSLRDEIEELKRRMDILSNAQDHQQKEAK